MDANLRCLLLREEEDVESIFGTAPCQCSFFSFFITARQPASSSETYFRWIAKFHPSCPHGGGCLPLYVAMFQIFFYVVDLIISRLILFFSPLPDLYDLILHGEAPFA